MVSLDIKTFHSRWEYKCTVAASDWIRLQGGTTIDDAEAKKPYKFST